VQPLLVLMAGLLSVGIFLENFARTRGYRAVDRAGPAAKLLATSWRRRIADGRRGDLDEVQRVFAPPPLVRAIPRISAGLAIVNVALFAAVIYSLRGEAASALPWRWDVSFDIALVLLAVHLLLSILARRGSRDIERELTTERLAFGDELIASLRNELIGETGTIGVEPPSHAGEVAGVVVPRRGARVDDLYFRDDQEPQAQFVVPLVGSLVQGGILSREAVSESRSLVALGRLDFRLEQRRTGNVAARWHEDARRSLTEPNERISGSPPGHLFAGAMARAAESENLSFGPGLFSPRRDDDLELARELSKACARKLDFAIRVATRRSTMPPLRCFPRRQSTWISAADHADAADAAWYGRVLVRVAQLDHPGQLVHWLEVTCSVAAVHRDGESLISALAEQLTWGERVRDPALMESVLEIASAKDEPRNALRPHRGFVPKMAQIMALRRLGDEAAALDVIREVTSEWTTEPYSVAALVGLSGIRFGFPSVMTLEGLIADEFIRAAEERGAGPEEALRLALAWLTGVVRLSASAEKSHPFSGRSRDYRAESSQLVMSAISLTLGLWDPGRDHRLRAGATREAFDDLLESLAKHPMLSKWASTNFDRLLSEWFPSAHDGVPR
jgi:hypothetical protein